MLEGIKKMELGTVASMKKNHSNRHPPAEGDEGECSMGCRTSVEAFSKCFAKIPLEGRT